MRRRHMRLPQKRLIGTDHRPNRPDLDERLDAKDLAGWRCLGDKGHLRWNSSTLGRMKQARPLLETDIFCLERGQGVT